MKFKQHILAVSLLLDAASFNAHAALISSTGADNVGLVYSSESNVTWTQDANLLKTLYDSDNSVISQIAAVTPTYKDPFYGLQTIDPDDFNTGTGQMSWWGGIAFVNYLSFINYGGSTQWRLPTVTDTGPPGCWYDFLGTDCGYNVDTNTGELAKLYYDELGGVAGSPIPNTPTFNNEQADVYWSGTECTRLILTTRGTSRPTMATRPTALSTSSNTHGQSVRDN